MYGKYLFVFVLILSAVFSSVTAFSAPVKKNVPEKSVVMEKNALLVDVRTPKEFAAGHLKGAVNIPNGDITLLRKAGAKKDTPLYLYCRSGRRVKAVVKNLKKEGYTRLYDFGGINDAGKRLTLPVEK
ncbi:MAG: rhodanese-like domain-containing protein [Lentisphaeria bacterium]|nr:rhodanese-like domain-containing protein [Lentisphaeria bacterium]